MQPVQRSRLVRPGLALALALAAGACGTSSPEIVAIEYLRATRTAESDQALARLDIDRIVERVQREITVVRTEGDSDQFLRESVETLLWGLFQETPREDHLTFDAPPADIDGDRATVVVTLRAPDGAEEQRTVHLRDTDDGWKVSGESIDDLVNYVIQRLEERF